MSGYEQISDHRFEGYDNHSLAGLVDQFKAGDAAQKFADASHALRELSASLAETDDVLRTELGKLGIEWQGAAGENAGKTINAQADYAGEADEAAKRNSQATAVQSASYSQSRNGLPEPAVLRGASETNLVDDVGGFFGYETDHAAEVKATQAAREQAIRGLDQYTEASRDALGQYQGIPQPPNFDVTTVSSATATVGSVQSPTGHVGGVPAGTSGVGSTPGGTAQLPGGGSVQLPGKLPGGVPGPLPGQLPGQLPGTVPNIPGGSTGQLPGLPGTVGALPTGPALAKVPGSNLGLGIGLGVAAGVGLGAAAATARGGRVVRGGQAQGQGPHGAPGSGTPEGKGAKASTPGTALTKGGAVGALEEERLAGRGAAAAAGTRSGKVGTGSMLQPAAVAKGEDEEDGEHIRKYGVDSDDVFGDERMVVQSVIGDDPDKR
ncbi:hypothetical protein [Actinosynnema sp. NPDC020468]|uniref:PPE domain-containing protein n=1 Tax=Actinosynnema sp. NPDC020468 TaxID=3154488 RepID=UPI00340DBC7C